MKRCRHYSTRSSRTRKAEAIEYEEYLRRIARLVRQVEEGLAEDTPEELKKSPALRALYNNLKMAGGTTARVDRVAEAPEEYDASVDPVLEKAKKDRRQGETGTGGRMAGESSPANKSSRLHCMGFCRMRPKWSGSS